MNRPIAGRWIIALGTLFLGAGVVLAQVGPGGMVGQQAAAKPQPPMERAFGLPGFQGRWWTHPRVVEYLKLTEEQQKAMDAILMEHREKLIDLRASLQKADLKLEELVGDAQPNEAAIVAQIDKVAQARAELEKANARFLLAEWSKLTPEQRAQVKEFRAKGWPRPEWGQGRMGREAMRPPMPQNRSDAAPKPPDAGAETKQ